MKKIAFIFTHAPHGTSFGREGLDFILGISAIFKKIGIFFVGDGVLQLFKSYKPENILVRDYIPSFSILSLYDITKYYCCESSLIERGIRDSSRFVLSVKILNSYLFRLKLESYNIIINF